MDDNLAKGDSVKDSIDTDKDCPDESTENSVEKHSFKDNLDNDLMMKDFFDKKFNSYDRGIGRQMNEAENRGSYISIMVLNIPDGLTQEGLLNVFRRFGDVASCSLRREKKQGFVEFSNYKEAQRSIFYFETKPIYGMKVKFCLPQEEYRQKKNKEMKERKEEERRREDMLKEAEERKKEEEKINEDILIKAKQRQEDTIQSADKNFIEAPVDVDEGIESFFAKKEDNLTYEDIPIQNLNQSFQELMEIGKVAVERAENNALLEEEAPPKEPEVASNNKIFRLYCHGNHKFTQKILEKGEQCPEYDAFREDCLKAITCLEELRQMRTLVRDEQDKDFSSEDNSEPLSDSGPDLVVLSKSSSDEASVESSISNENNESKEVLVQEPTEANSCDEASIASSNENNDSEGALPLEQTQTKTSVESSILNENNASKEKSIQEPTEANSCDEASIASSNENNDSEGALPLEQTQTKTAPVHFPEDYKPVKFQDLHFSLTESKMFEKVNIVSLFNYLMFFIRKVEDEPRLEEMDLTLNQHYSTLPMSAYRPKLEEVCVAFNEKKKTWQRALVLKNNPSDSYKVLFVDHGSIYFVKYSQIRPLLPEFAAHPIYALPSSLCISLHQGSSNTSSPTIQIMERILEMGNLFAFRLGPKEALFHQIILKNFEVGYIAEFLVANNHASANDNYFQPTQYANLPKSSAASDLTVGSKYSARITEINKDSTVHFCLSSAAGELKSISDILAAEYADLYTLNNEQPEYDLGEVVVVKKKRCLNRCRIVSKNPQGYVVEEIDSGAVLDVKNNNLFFLLPKLAQIPPCAFSMELNIPANVNKDDFIESLEDLIGEPLEIEVIVNGNKDRVVKIYSGHKCLNE